MREAGLVSNRVSGGLEFQDDVAATEVVAVTARVGGAGGTPLLRLTKLKRKEVVSCSRVLLDPVNDSPACASSRN